SPQSNCRRKKEMLSFLLFKTLPGFKDVFSKVSESTIQTGDILLFPIETCSSGSIWSFKHAAVYCNEGEVIHLQKIRSSGNRTWIIKEGYKAMKKDRGKCEIYRKKDGIDLNDFYSKVREAMNSEAKYDITKNNCIHFALFLLGLVDFYMQ
ncbi:hypothetical protein N301_01793, partial [Charadrius vociferus]